ncbi:hypothetical protein BLJ79_13235 [Arthrobacter sp. UCD-GKA]|nr:hypothetical protein BLJ79_13235 [Arthrobacter sp. UCD-GKA]
MIEKPGVVIKEAQVLPRNQRDSGIPSGWDSQVVLKEMCLDVGWQSHGIPPVSHNNYVEHNIALPKQALECPVQFSGTISHGEHNDAYGRHVS